ncbi:proton-transporting V-type ATPase complex assembly regulator TMEM9-like [Choristoneura fumiferana]|uniref:proton-transporting V-type ATPase complex assembly regulator TMEM9-like n=1 Tax=Choristoneura fumiferana TaxID=7141 RepID=UPI003D1554A1
MFTKVLIYSSLILSALGQVYEDKRCRCVCPSPAEVLNKTLGTDPKLIISDAPPNKCNCIGVVLQRLGDEIKGHEPEYCLRCDCRYETRNTTIIKVVVITIIWLLTLLLIYSAFLMCLDPFVRRQRVQHYRERGSEEARHLITELDDEV